MSCYSQTALASGTKFGIFLLFILLCGCGVRVEVMTPTVPTPTPRPLPEINYDLGGVWRVQANPRVSFTESSQVETQLFMNGDDLGVYLLTERALWLAAEYDVTWFNTAAQNSAQVRLSVYTRADADSEWEAWDTTERLLTSAAVPANQRDNINVTLWFEQPQQLEVRAEVGITAFLANGETVNTVDVNEFRLYVMRDPGEVEADPARLQPGFGELNPEYLLFDWRNWNGGPCELQNENEAFAPACEAIESGNAGLAAIELVNAAEANKDNFELIARVYSQVGLLAVAIGEFETAEQAFQFTSEAYVNLDQAWEAAISLHNLAAAYVMLEDESNVYVTLALLQELRGLFYDEPGYKLSQANNGLLSGEWWRVEDALSYFEEYGLPQQDVVRLWLEQNQD